MSLVSKPALLRIKKELELLESQPPEGICVWMIDDSMFHLKGEIIGPKNSPYEEGVFLLEIVIPEMYPNQPPQIRFITPVYHPNIDTGGRICINALKMPPAGVWSPSLNIATVLVNLQILLAEPNPDDGLMQDITLQFRQNLELYQKTAKDWTTKHAINKNCREKLHDEEKNLKHNSIESVRENVDPLINQNISESETEQKKIENSLSTKLVKPLKSLLPSKRKIN